MPQDYAAGKDAQLEKAVEVAMAEIAKLKPNQPKLPVFPTHPALKTTAGNDSFVLPFPGSSFPITDTKVETLKPVTNVKFADYIGQFETPMGLLTFQQEGEKFVGVSPKASASSSRRTQWRRINSPRKRQACTHLRARRRRKSRRFDVSYSKRKRVKR
jgi:hypothetical protein